MTQTYDQNTLNVKYSQKNKQYIALIETIDGRFIQKAVNSSFTTLEKIVRKSEFLPASVEFSRGTRYFFVDGKKLGKTCAIIIDRKKREKQKLQVSLVTEDEIVLAEFPASTLSEAKTKIYRTGIVPNSIVINHHDPTYFNLPLDFPFKDFVKVMSEEKSEKKTLQTAIITVKDTSKKAARNSKKALKNGKKAISGKITAKIKINGKKAKILTAKDLGGIKKNIKDAGQLPAELLSKITFGENVLQF